MAVSRLIAGMLPGAVLRFAQRLRFPHLFLITLVVFVIDLLIPDLVPFADEILLGLTTMVLAAWKSGRPPETK